MKAYYDVLFDENTIHYVTDVFTQKELVALSSQLSISLIVGICKWAQTKDPAQLDYVQSLLDVAKQLYS